MATNKLQWKRIAKGDKLPCQSFLRKKNGEILKLSTGAGVTVGQDAYYLPVDDVINVIKDYPVEESEDEKIRKEIIDFVKSRGGFKGDWIAWLEKQGEHANFRNNIQIGDKVTRNEDGVLVNLSQLNRVAKKDEKQGKQKHQYISRPRYIGEEELLVEQKPAEWSKEDERIKNNLLSELTNLSVRKLIEKETEKKYASWLKSLRPQSYWRPSEEQMEALEHFIVYHNGSTNYAKDLEELRLQLKKLREE